MKIQIGGLNLTWGKSQKRAYDAADKGRRSKSFRLAASTGVNREIAMALTTLRDRARHMGRNNGWAKRAVEAITKHTVGEGIQPSPIGPLSKTKKVKEIWRDWAGSTACDWDGKLTFYGLQELAMRTIVESGEALILRRWFIPDEDDECKVPLKLQVLEGDHLDHTRNGPNEMGYVRMGVQYDDERRVIGYWLFDYHPGDGIVFDEYTESKFIPKSEVLHIFEVSRPGQVRGLPIGVAAFTKQNDFSDYEDAQLVKQKVAACFAGFVLGSEDAEDDLIEELEPGIIAHLGSGESMEFANPPAANDYDPYSSRILQGIAAAYGITYEMLTMDYSKVNFTSGRMAKIDVTQNFRSWQYNMVVPQMCAPVWSWFMRACLVAGLVTKPTKTDWTAPRIQQLDPVKEVQAQRDAVKGGLATISEIIRETGREPEEFFEEYAQDVERLKALGIYVDIVNVSQSGANTVASDDEATQQSINTPPENEIVDDDANGADADATPAEKYGVGGTTAMVEIITNEQLTDTQKVNILIEWFGLTEEQAKIMLAKNDETQNNNAVQSGGNPALDA